VPISGGLYPWCWEVSEEDSFRALQGRQGRGAQGQQGSGQGGGSGRVSVTGQGVGQGWGWFGSMFGSGSGSKAGSGSGSGSGSSPALLVAPILQKLILNREPERVLRWVDRVSRWEIRRIIPSHLENNIRADGRDFRKAFAFLNPVEAEAGARAGAAGARTVEAGRPHPIFETQQPTNTQGTQPTVGDFALLQTLSKLFTRLGIVAEEVLL
jgi:hypothetical protein